MALSKQDIKNNYPLPVYNYKVDVGGETLAFSEVSGLSMGYETITYKESKIDGGVGPVVMQMPGQETQSSISLRKGYVKTKNIKVFYNWLNSIALNQVEKKNITVSLCDETGAPVVVWTVIDAFPTKLDAPGFSADSNEVAIESMELAALKITMEEA
ncbi:MAG: phage tail protein [Sinomicrobium sp.]|nr:phage tail protein [Sinomicrobium sp.]